MKEDDMKSRGKKRGRPKKCAPGTFPLDTAANANVTDATREGGTAKDRDTVKDGDTAKDGDTVKDGDTAKDSGTCLEETVVKKGPRKVLIPKCPEDRECCPSCQAYRDGRCAALADVSFKDNVCPFYKDSEVARAERIASMEKLEDTGREDLIQKYYGYKFDRVLGNELVGISYSFDDDHCVYVDEEEVSEDISESDGDPDHSKTAKNPDGISFCLPEEVIV